MAGFSGVAHRRTALGATLVALAAWPAGAQSDAGQSVTPASGAAPFGHVVLLGDSTLDNKAYVGGGPDVAAQLRAALPAGWRVTLAAVDGAVTGDVPGQLRRAPREATHLVVSVGGNDALRQEGVLGEDAHSVGEALLRLAAVRDRFRRDYRDMLDAVLARPRPLAVCTVYDPRFPNPVRRRAGAAGLALFNDAIAREAFARGLPLVDLRLVCGEDADFATPIEPSARGGAKIAAAIARFATEARPLTRRSEVFVG